MKILKERRSAVRWPLTVLVKCLVSDREDGVESDMWAKDVSEKGMRLESTEGSGLPPVFKREFSSRADDLPFEKGRVITVQDLFYDDDGSHTMKGKILWVRHTASDDHWALGIRFTGITQRSKNLIHTFQDFLNVVKTSTRAKPARAAST